MDKQSHNTTPPRRRHHPLKTPHRFRLSFINENTFNEVWSLQLSQRKVVVGVILLVLAMACMVATIIVVSPIRMLLPGYLRQSQRHENIVNSMRLDSLVTEIDIHNAYLKNLARLLNDSLDSETSAAALNDSIVPLPVDSLMSISEREARFVKQFEEQEKFNLSVLSPLAAEGLSFIAPITPASITSGKGQTAMSVTITAPRKATVAAVYNGTVVDAYYTISGKNTVMVQHPNGFMSKYSGITTLFVKKGDKLSTGSPLGLANSTEANAETPIVLELWNKGTPLDPRDYIPF